MDENKFQTIIDFAIEKEQEAIDLYENARQMVKNESAQKIFANFVEEEKKHKQFLENFDTQNIPKATADPVADLKISNYLVEKRFNPDMSYQDILILAMKREEKAVELYKDLAERVIDDPEAKNLFTMLSQEEAKHKLRLETLYDDTLLTEN